LKKTCILLLAVLMMFAFVACSNSSNAPGGATPNASEDVTASPDPSGASSDQEPILFGNHSYLTGQSAELGKNIKRGFELAIDKANAEGGINGRMIVGKTYDDQGKSETTLGLVTRLIEQDGAKAIVASCSSPAINSYRDYLMEKKVVATSGGVGTTWTNVGNPYVFRSTPSAAYTNPTLVNTMKEFGVTKLGIVYINSDFGKDGLTELEPLLQEAGIDYQIESYNTNDTDFSPQIQKLKAAGVSHFLNYGNTPEIANFVKTARRLGITDYIFSVEGASSPDIRNVAGDDANGLVYVSANVIPDSPEDAASELEREYIDAYIKKYGEMPTSDVGYRTYDGASLIVEAMRNAEDLNKPETIAEAFKNIKGYEGIGGVFDFTSGTGDGLFVSKMFVVHGNKNVNLEIYKSNIDITKPYSEVKGTSF
jgi:branched-chain amino acid transport system substrate-binding protein